MVIVIARDSSARLKMTLQAARGIASAENQRRSSPRGRGARLRGMAPAATIVSRSERGLRRTMVGERIATAGARAERNAGCCGVPVFFMYRFSQPPKAENGFLQ
jgi:hypothetical protein